MTFPVFSLHKVYNRSALTFSKDEYSRFKYGSKQIAKKFGKELGLYLFEHLMKTYPPKDIQYVIAPAPYMFIPTATFALKDYLISTLNPLLIKAGYKVVQESKVYRETKYTADYGAMSKEERDSVIGAESFHTDVEFLRLKHIIFLDDIKITGAHQERMEEMIERMNIENLTLGVTFAYYAELDDPKTDPTIEDHLNYYSVKNLLDIKNIIQNESFIFNTRNVKYILNSDHIQCVNFLEYQSKKFVDTLYHWSIGNSYHLEPKFKMNFMYLQELVNR